jgi:hypothetical protein
MLRFYTYLRQNFVGKKLAFFAQNNATLLISFKKKNAIFCRKSLKLVVFTLTAEESKKMLNGLLGHRLIANA